MRRKEAAKFGLTLVVGLFSAIIFAVIALVGIVVLISENDTLQYPKHRVAGIYSKYAESFETVRKHIDNIDFSVYPDDAVNAPRVTIFSPEELPDFPLYTEVISADWDYEIEIDDDAVNCALDDLFRNANVIYIQQTRNADTRSVYFNILSTVGLVYSRNGEPPTDTHSDMIYSYKRIDDNWFYWRGTWPD
jgi:hypothetical protein